MSFVAGIPAQLEARTCAPPTLCALIPGNKVHWRHFSEGGMFKSLNNFLGNVKNGQKCVSVILKNIRFFGGRGFPDTNGWVNGAGQSDAQKKSGDFFFRSRPEVFETF